MSSRAAGGGAGDKQGCLETERKGLRLALPSLGARRASCRRGPLSVPPTAASSDHLLVFPGTLPNPGTCPHPACLSPSLLQAPARGCRLAWPPPSRHCRVEGRRPQAGARPAGGCCRVGTGQPGLAPGVSGRKGCPLACLASTPLPADLCVSVCPACMPDCFPAVSGMPASWWLLHVFSAGLGLLVAGPLAARAEPTSLVTDCMTDGRA